MNQIDVLFDGVDILCLTETWLYEQFDDNLLSIRNRKLLHWDRSNGYSNGVTKSRGGGVACYIRKDLAPSACILSNLCVTNPHIELLACPSCTKNQAIPNCP